VEREPGGQVQPPQDGDPGRVEVRVVVGRLEVVDDRLRVDLAAMDRARPT
jgi:hypothetical protein